MKLRTVVGLVLGVALSGSAAWAQQGGTGSAPKASWNYARGGAVAARRPGLMVSQGVQRYSNAQNDIISRARQGPEITDTLADRPTKPITQAKAEAIKILFDNLTAMIVAYNAGQTGGGQTPDGGTSATDLSTLLGGPIHGPGD